MYGHGHLYVVSYAITEARQHDCHLYGLAVAKSLVIAERVDERAKAEDPVARFDVVQGASRPQRRPRADEVVARPFEPTVVGEVAPRDQGVETLVDHHPLEGFE